MAAAAFHQSDDRVGRVWQVRERTEYEAASHFAHLAGELRALGYPESLALMAVRAARDELEHARLCREVIASHAPALPPLPPHPTQLGPGSLSRWQRTLYQAVALCCVTETLSVALLLEMRACVRDPAAAEAVGRIARDESRHSQIGWAALAHARSAGDLAWVSAHLPAMLRAALHSEELPAAAGDLADHGILPAARCRAVTGAVIDEVILPGLRRYGIEGG